MSCADTLTHPGTAGTSPSATESGGLERVRFFPRQLLTADDMRTEQDYFREKQRRHNRFLHGWGVVCGLEVRLDPEKGPMAVTICPGYALSPHGDEIYVPDPVPFDIAASLRRAPDPCEPDEPLHAGRSVPPEQARALRLVIRYVERPTRPMRTLPAGCGCDDTECEYSRLRDGFDIRCIVTREGELGTDAPPRLCGKGGSGTTVLTCPPQPASPWVELATIPRINANGESMVRLVEASVDMSKRRVVYSSAVIQQQVIVSCCSNS